MTTPRILPRLSGILRLAAVCCFLALPLSAQESAKRTYDIPAGEAAKTLKQFSEQSGLGMIIASETARGIRTNPLKGDFTSRDALDLLLDGTGLVAERDAKSGAFAVRRETDIEAKNVSRAIAESGRPVSSSTNKAVENDEKVVMLNTFEVFGQKTLNMDIKRTRDDAQPYVVFESETIEQSGIGTLEDFLLQRLPMVTSRAPRSRPSSATSPSAINGQGSIISLRGLSSEQTLILVDGRRTSGPMIGTSLFQTDLNGIPMSAIERIEVLPSTASAIYGGGATGGVINIVLKRSFAGTEIRLNYRNTFDTDSAERRVDINTAFALENGKTNVALSATYSDANTLLYRDRAFIQESVNMAFANDPMNPRNHARDRPA